MWRSSSLGLRKALVSFFPWQGLLSKLTCSAAPVDEGRSQALLNMFTAVFISLMRNILGRIFATRRFGGKLCFEQTPVWEQEEEPVWITWRGFVYCGEALRSSSGRGDKQKQCSEARVFVGGKGWNNKTLTDKHVRNIKLSQFGFQKW